MNKFKTEEGYVLIMGFVSVFMNNAITHTKQEKAVDEEHLTVSVAEMGVEHYSTELNNLYHKSQKALEDLIIINLKEIVDNSSKINEEEIIEELNMKLYSLLENLFISADINNDETTVVTSNYKYSLGQLESGKFLDISYDEPNHLLLVKAKVYGINERTGKNILLDFVQEFSLPETSAEIQQVLGVDEDKGDFPVIDLNHISESCNFNNDILPHDCRTTDLTIKNNSKLKIENNKIKVAGEFNLDNNNYRINNSTLDIDGDFIAVNKLNVVESLIKVKSFQSDKNNFTLENSHLYVEENLTTKNNFNAKNSTVIIVNGDVTLGTGNGPSLTGNSILCVGGNLYLKSRISIDQSSSVYVKGEVKPLKNGNTNSSMEQLSKNIRRENFPDRCIVSSTTNPEVPSELNLDLKDSIINVEY